MSKIVPLISSGTAGPLGVLPCPACGKKVSLKLPEKLLTDIQGLVLVMILWWLMHWD